MQCEDFEQVIEQCGFAELPEAAKAHRAGCPSCTALTEDFSAILAAAREMPAEVEPPARVWVALEARLEAEGIIRQLPLEALPVQTPAWRKSFATLFSGRIVATAGVAALVLIAGVYQVRHWPVPRPGPAAAVAVPEPYAETDSTLDREEQSLGPIENVGTLGSGASNVDTALRENLATVNAFIKECRKRLAEDPDDPMAREYLSTAYQQKAEILAAMMERGRSVN
jgi:hypothetical protein